MKKLILFLLISLFGKPLFSQPVDTPSDSLIYEIAFKISPTDPLKGLKLADSIFNFSKDKRYRAKALFLSANIMGRENKYEDALNYANEALEIAETTKDYSLIASVYGFLSAVNNQIGFSGLAEDYLKEGMNFVKKIDEESQRNALEGNFSNGLGRIAENNGEFREALSYYAMGIEAFEKMDDSSRKTLLIGMGQSHIGGIHLTLGNYAQARTLFLNSLKNTNKVYPEENLKTAEIYHGLGNAYLDLKVIDSAGIYLHKARVIAEQFDHHVLRERVYGDLIDFYKERGMQDSINYFSMQYQSLIRINREEDRKNINAAMNLVTQKEDQTTDRKPLYLIFSLAALGGVLGLVLWRRKNLKPQLVEINNLPKAEVIAKIEGGNSFTLSEAARNELREKIKKFEKDEEFLKKDLTFPAMVSRLDTNSKYLHYFLKENFNKDYSTYINDLRINYIVEKLEKDPIFRKYKITYLGKKSGFSSYNNFSKNFKRVLSQTPSEFIESLNKSE